MILSPWPFDRAKEGPHRKSETLAFVIEGEEPSRFVRAGLTMDGIW